MYMLIAELKSQAWSGELARQSFTTIDAAETAMARWARFGVNGSCDRPTAVRILDEADTEIRRWSWRLRRPMPPPPAPSSSPREAPSDPIAT